MKRLLIAVSSAAILIASTAPAAMAQQDYPPCTSPGQDHCRVVAGHHEGHHKGHHHKKGHLEGHPYSMGHHHHRHLAHAKATTPKPDASMGNPQH